jgi:hypothetical protein
MRLFNQLPPHALEAAKWVILADLNRELLIFVQFLNRRSSI